MIIKKIFFSLVFIELFYAQTVHAASLFNYVNLLNTFIVRAVPLIIGIAMLIFLWGIARFLFSGGDEKVLEDTKRLMVWGIITLFVMVSVWGIVKVLQNDLFGTGNGVYNIGIQQP